MRRLHFPWARVPRAVRIRIPAIIACSLLAGYAGVRSTADVTTTHFNFKGFTQTAYWDLSGGNTSSGAQVQCAENLSGPGMPNGGPSAYVAYYSETWDWSTSTWTDTSLSASGSLPRNSP